MKMTGWLIERPIAACMILLLAAPVARAEPMPGQEAPASQGSEGAPPINAQQSSSATETSPSADVAAPTSRDIPAPDAEARQSSERNAPVDNPQTGAAEPQTGSVDPQTSPAGSQAGSSDSQAGGSQASPAQEQSSPAKPVGTAAAPAVKATGVAGSRVSGAAIAPAKQRRVHIFLIRVAVVVGACVAVGTVVALTHATPSQPH